MYNSGNDGICCDYGNGYFTVKDSQGNVLYGDQNDGDYGSEASFMISTTGATEVEVGETFVDIFSYSGEVYYPELPIRHVKPSISLWPFIVMAAKPPRKQKQAMAMLLLMKQVHEL